MSDMKRENREPTTREMWGELAGVIQQDVNERLQDLQLEIETANIRLADMYAKDPEMALSMSQDIVEYLDEKWGHIGDVFIVAGNWYMPTVGVGSEGVLARHEYQEAFSAVKSNGFIVKSMEIDGEEEEAPRIGMSFIVGHSNVMTPSMQGSLEFLAYADTSDVTVHYLRPGNNEVVSSDPHEVWKTITEADALLRLYTNHPDSTFYNVNARKQEQFLRDIIDSAEASFPAPDSFDVAFIHDTETSIIYYRQSGELIKGYNNDHALKLSGAIMGVTLVDVYQNGYGKHYGSPEEFDTSWSGLCLIVQPIESSFQMEANFDENILVPIRAINGTLKLSVQ